MDKVYWFISVFRLLLLNKVTKKEKWMKNVQYIVYHDGYIGSYCNQLTCNLGEVRVAVGACQCIIKPVDGDHVGPTL